MASQRTVKTYHELYKLNPDAFELLRQVAVSTKDIPVQAHIAGALHVVKGMSAEDEVFVADLRKKLESEELQGAANAQKRALITDMIADYSKNDYKAGFDVAVAFQKNDDAGDRIKVSADSVLYVPFPRIARGSNVSAHYAVVYKKKDSWSIYSLDLIGRTGNLLVKSADVAKKLSDGAKLETDSPSRLRQYCACMHNETTGKKRGIESLVQAIETSTYANCGGVGTPNAYLWGNGIMQLQGVTASAFTALVTKPEHKIPDTFKYTEKEKTG